MEQVTSMKSSAWQVHRITGRFGHVLILIVLWAITAPASAQTGSEAPARNDSAVIYRSPAERREAGLGRQLTEWLSISGLAEFGAEYQGNNFRGGISTAGDDETWIFVQLGFDVTFSDSINAALLLISDVETYAELDEGLISLETGTWSISAGRQYVPFGQYYSHFVIDPLLTFSLTRATALALYHSYEEVLDLSAFVFDGGDGTLDWGLGIGFSPLAEVLTIELGYMSDLGRASESLFADFDDVHQNRVAGLNAAALAATANFEITAELVKALHSFTDAEGSRKAPLAWNMEVAYYPWPFLALAARVEGSEELENEPARQYGVSATWRIHKLVTLTADYLFGEFREGVVFDENGNELATRHKVAAQLSMEF